jgi:hypothetical protein
MGIRDETGRLKGLPHHWQQYGICLLLHLTLPVIPLLLELWVVGRIQITSITLGASMYVLAIGVSSRNPLLLGLALVEGIIFAVFFGAASHNTNVEHAEEQKRLISANDGFFWWTSIAGMAFMFLLHALERYNRHVVERAPFLEIGRSDAEGRR